VNIGQFVRCLSLMSANVSVKYSWGAAGVPKTKGWLMLRIQNTLANHRRRIIPGLVAVALAAGFGVSIIATPNALADYTTGCGYGYNAAGGGFGSGTGNNYAYDT